MYILKYLVRKTRLRARSTYEDATPGSNGYIRLEFDYDEDWAGLTKSILISVNRSVPDVRLLEGDGTAYVVDDKHIQSPGLLTIGLKGVGDTYSISTSTAEIKIPEGIYEPGETPPAPVIDVYEQIIKTMRDVTADAHTILDGATEQAAASAASAAAAKISEDNAAADAAQTLSDRQQTGTDRTAVSGMLSDVQQEHTAVQVLADQVRADKTASVASAAAAQASATQAGQHAGQAKFYSDSAGASATAADASKTAAQTAAKQAQTERQTVEQLTDDFKADAAQATKSLNDLTTQSTATITSTGTTQVQAVTAEGDMQVARVQAEGAAYQEQIDRLGVEKLSHRDIADFSLTGKTSGATIEITDSIDWPLLDLQIIGRTEQGPNPSPDSPQELYSVGTLQEDGTYSITVYIGDRPGVALSSCTVTLDEPLRGVEKASDILCERNGQIGILRKIKQVSSSEAKDSYINENFTVEGSVAYCTVLLSDKLILRETGHLICSHFLEQFSLSKTPGIVWSEASTATYFTLPLPLDTSASEALDYFKSLNAQIVYELATPIFQPLSPDDQAKIRALRAYAGGTYVWTDSQVQPTLTVTYAKDNNALEARVSTLEDKAIKKYTVEFSSSNTVGTRRDDAVGMRAEVQIGPDGAGVVNDFDKVSFFDRPVCCCTWDKTARKWRVNAYKGEPGFAADGSNGEVMRECKPFWYKADFSKSGAPTYVSVTGTPCEGYTLAPMFPDGHTKAYCPSYWLATVDGKATSRSGVYPDSNSINGFMEQARTFDARAHLETIEALFSDYLLQLVEYATKDLQTVMLGACNMRVAVTDPISKVISPTQFEVSSVIGVDYVEGQEIAIGTTAQGSQVIDHVMITSIITDGDTSIITLDQPVTSMVAGNYISSRPWTNGATDFVTASSGIMENNSKYPCIWRGKVDPWADAQSIIGNLLVRRHGAGTEAEPYTYRYAYLPEPWKYANGEITPDYIDADYELPAENGYAKTISADSRYPWLIGPTELGASATTYAAAFYYRSNNDISAVRVGGYIINSRYCSPVMISANNPPRIVAWYFRARLFVSP